LLLEEKRAGIIVKVDRYNNGLNVLRETKKNVDTLAESIKIKMVEVGKVKEDTNIVVAKVEKASAEAAVEAKAAGIIMVTADKCVAEATEIQIVCDKELGEALPALTKAQDAVDKLDKSDIGELKGFSSPKDQYKDTMEAIMLLIGVPYKKPSDLKDWKLAQKEMSNPEGLKTTLMNLKPEMVTEDTKNKADAILKKPDMEVERVMKMSKAAGGLCLFANCFVSFFNVSKTIAPLKASLEEAMEKKDTALKELNDAKAKVKDCEDNVEQQNKILAQ
jgi:dynein heavy chain